MPESPNAFTHFENNNTYARMRNQTTLQLDTGSFGSVLTSGAPQGSVLGPLLLDSRRTPTNLTFTDTISNIYETLCRKEIDSFAENNVSQNQEVVDSNPRKQEDPKGREKTVPG